MTGERIEIPFVSFQPLEAGLDDGLRTAFERTYARSWYISGDADKQFEESFNSRLDELQAAPKLPHLDRMNERS